MEQMICVKKAIDAKKENVKHEKMSAMGWGVKRGKGGKGEKRKREREGEMEKKKRRKGEKEKEEKGERPEGRKKGEARAKMEPTRVGAAISCSVFQQESGRVTIR